MMSKPTVDELIDAAKQALEELRATVHESVDAAVEGQAKAEEFTHEAQQITHPEEGA